MKDAPSQTGNDNESGSAFGSSSMITTRRNFRAGAPTLAALLLLFVSCVHAQTPGYVSGLTGIEVFDSVTGQLLNTFPSTVNLEGTLAVSKNGATLYIAAEAPPGTGSPAVLELLSSATGQVLSTIAGLSMGGRKVILGPAGTYAFVMCSSGPSGSNTIGIVNLAQQAVVGYIFVDGGYPVDILLSPNGKQLYVSTESLNEDAVRTAPLASVQLAAGKHPVYLCKAIPGICVFDTSTFAVTGTATAPNGLLSLSQDGSSLYSLSVFNQTLEVVNTATLASTKIQLAPGVVVTGLAVAPSGNQAVIGTYSGSAFSFYLLDTLTNKFTGTFPAPPSTQLAFGSSTMVFSPDGSSLWTIGGCDYSCSLLIGQSFPSGNVIAQTSLGANPAALGISF